MSYAGHEYLNQKHLETRGVPVTARVTDARKMEEDGKGPAFEVQYAFEVPGDPRTFTLGDGTGRENLWATTDGQPEWQLALRTGHVQVIYLTEDPRINRLVTRRGHPLGDPGGVFVLALLILGLCVAVAWLEVTGRGQQWRRFLPNLRGPSP